MAIDPQLASQLDAMGYVLRRRASKERQLDRYYEGDTPLPDAVVQAQVTKAYYLLMGMATAPWGSLVVDSVQDRLEVTGIQSEDRDIDDQLWGVWQDNNLDAESKLAHKTALIAGRAFALVWPGRSGAPEVSLDGPGQMVVRYREGSRRERVAAMRYWVDDASATPFATLYLPDGIYKFVGERNVPGPQGITWRQRNVPGEPWPVPNPYGVVPVIELALNRRLKPGSWGFARGEYEHVTSTIDRINLLTFLGLIVAFWQGFPIRAVIGEKILRADDGTPIAPFTIGADQIAQFENPEAKLDSYPAADRGNLSIYAELDQLGSLTKTPLTAFPRPGAISNISADTIRALEGGLVAKIPAHKASLAEGWQEVLRLCGLMLDRPVELSPRAEITWTDHQTRSLAERADAASKLAPVLPQVALLEYVLNATQEDIARWKAEQASDAFAQLVAAAKPAPAPAPSTGPTSPASGPPSNGASGG